MTLLRRWTDIGPHNGLLFHTLVEFAESGDSQEANQMRLEEMLRLRKVPANKKDASGLTALSKAISRESYRLAKFFIGEYGM